MEKPEFKPAINQSELNHLFKLQVGCGLPVACILNTCSGAWADGRGRTWATLTKAALRILASSVFPQNVSQQNLSSSRSSPPCLSKGGNSLLTYPLQPPAPVRYCPRQSSLFNDGKCKPMHAGPVPDARRQHPLATEIEKHTTQTLQGCRGWITSDEAGNGWMALVRMLLDLRCCIGSLKAFRG